MLSKFWKQVLPEEPGLGDLQCDVLPSQALGEGQVGGEEGEDLGLRCARPTCYVMMTWMAANIADLVLIDATQAVVSPPLAGP